MTVSRSRSTALAVLMLAAAPWLAAQAPQSTPGSRVTFTDTKIDNGLRVIVSEDHSAPVFSIAVTYNVGSRDERKGRTGFAHLFEHMMFKGSEQVGPGEHFTLIFNNGGSMNGTTNEDRTLYYETLPSNQLDLALFLEADRMWSLEVTKENLDNQRNAVQEERRLGVDNQPYGRTFELINELAYENFAYEHSVIGSMADLSAATVDDVKSFFRTYYAPNNAVLSIVGDVDTKTTIEKVRKYFGRVPSQPAPQPVDMTEPPQTAERRQVVEDALARLPRIDIVWHQPPAGTPDDDALTVLATVLSGGRSSRFYESLVRTKQLTQGVSASSASTRGPGLFSVGGNALPGKSIADLEQAIYAEIERVKTGPIADWEMEKARNTQKRQFVGGLGSSLQRAVLLGQYALYYNDPNLINTYTDRINKVTAADLQRVAKQYLVETNRTVVITNPKPTGASEGGR
ncbi:MAG TPA: pitrilysin family protein [Vicinamibacterales bacterium]|nr:pitrilysin family protein [Vicinamibacterales bacterium]